MNDAILIFHFMCNCFLNYIEDNNLKKHPLFRQKIKNLLCLFESSLKEQIDTFVRGSVKRPLDKMSNEAADGLHFGTMYIDQIFQLIFKINDMPDEKQKEFERDFNQLITKYQ